MRIGPFILEDPPEFQIGSFGIWKWPGTEGGFWISNRLGEGMQVSERTLGQMFHEFFKENF